MTIGVAEPERSLRDRPRGTFGDPAQRCVLRNAELDVGTAGRAGGWRGLACPLGEGEVVMIAVRGEEDGAGVITRGHIEADHPGIELGRAYPVGDVQMDVPHSQPL